MGGEGDGAEPGGVGAEPGEVGVEPEEVGATAQDPQVPEQPRRSYHALRVCPKCHFIVSLNRFNTYNAKRIMQVYCSVIKRRYSPLSTALVKDISRIR